MDVRGVDVLRIMERAKIEPAILSKKPAPVGPPLALRAVG
jgi:hypothetical protein